MYTTIPCCINTQGMHTGITLWDTFSPELLTSPQGGESRGLSGSSQQQSAKPSSIPGLLCHLFPRSFLQWCQEGVRLHEPEKPRGIRVCLAAGRCSNAQGLDGLSASTRDCRASWDGAGMARKDFSCWRRTGPLPSPPSSLHYFDLEFQPRSEQPWLWPSPGWQRTLKTLLRCCAPDDGFPSLGILSASPRHSAVLQKPSLCAMVT